MEKVSFENQKSLPGVLEPEEVIKYIKHKALFISSLESLLSNNNGKGRDPLGALILCQRTGKEYIYIYIYMYLYFS